MATNLAIDPELLDHALAVSGVRTKKEAVTIALREFIARNSPVKASAFDPGDAVQRR